MHLLDAAYWIKGCSSLGLLRYAALLDVDRGATRGRDMCLIDIKEATTAVAPRLPGAQMPRDNAQRVVAAARAMSPHLGERTGPSRLLGRSVFIRQLLPEDLKLELDRVSVDDAVKSAYCLARVVGRAYARHMNRDARRAWRWIDHNGCKMPNGRRKSQELFMLTAGEIHEVEKIVAEFFLSPD